MGDNPVQPPSGSPWWLYVILGLIPALGTFAVVWLTARSKRRDGKSDPDAIDKAFADAYADQSRRVRRLERKADTDRTELARISAELAAARRQYEALQQIHQNCLIEKAALTAQIDDLRRQLDAFENREGDV